MQTPASVRAKQAVQSPIPAMSDPVTYSAVLPVAEETVLFVAAAMRQGQRLTRRRTLKEVLSRALPPPSEPFMLPDRQARPQVNATSPDFDGALYIAGRYQYRSRPSVQTYHR